MLKSAIRCGKGAKLLAPLVLLPGMMCDARLFTPVIERLSSTRPIMCFPLTGSHSIQGLAETVLRHAPPSFVLAGLSMGGIVAMEMIKKAPTRIERLALLDTNCSAENADKAATRAPQIEAVKAGGLWAVMRDEMKPNYLTDGPERGRILDLCMQMAMDLGPDVFVAQSESLRDREDYAQTLTQVNVPSLVLCGEDDELCSVAKHETMHELLPNSTLTVVPNAGHLVVLEQPDAACDALLKWLS